MEPMGRICPFLALAADHRTVVDGYDPDHRCHAVAEPDPLDRTRQLQLCLTEAHRTCERYVAALEWQRAESAGQSLPSPDARIARTRLVLDPGGVEGPVDGRPQMGRRARRVLLAAAAALIILLVLVSGAVEGLAGLVTGPSATPTPSLAPSSTPMATGLASTVEAAPTPSPAPPASAPAPTPTPAAQATPRSYVVQQGDTLFDIAARFGTTIAAIQQANGLGDSDVINPGQVLIIP
jgi:LysM repeat protein